MTDIRVSLPKPCSERWGDMRPVGCNRFCDSCEKVIHDLARLTVDEAEALLRSDDEVCVRAEIGNGGEIAVRPSRSGTARKLVLAVSAATTVAAAPAYAATPRPKGAITGQITGPCGRDNIVAVGGDGRVYSARTGWDGKYKIKHLPDGRYEVIVDPEIPESRTSIGHVVVAGGRKTKLNGETESRCIIVGQMILQDPQTGRG